MATGRDSKDIYSYLGISRNFNWFDMFFPRMPRSKSRLIKVVIIDGTFSWKLVGLGKFELFGSEGKDCIKTIVKTASTVQLINNPFQNQTLNKVNIFLC